MFVGTFEHSLDDKGRVVLPSNFRDRLGGKGFLAKLDGCLGMWTEEGYAEVANRLTEHLQLGKALQMARRSFAASTHEVHPDSQGRITIPQRLRDYANLDGDVVIIGSMERVEFWNADQWTQARPEGDQNLSEAVIALGL